jgi:hypothetical protein
MVYDWITKIIVKIRNGKGIMDMGMRKQDQGGFNKQARSSLLWRWILVGSVIIFIFIVSSSLPDIHHGYVKSDFYEFGAGGREIVEGRNPYDPVEWKVIRSQFEGDWVANPASVYPMLTNLLFTPLSVLPLSSAASVWIALSQLMILASLYLSIISSGFIRWRRYLVFLLLGVVMFRPAMIVVDNGQLDALLLLLLSFSIWLQSKERWFLAGFVLGFFALKPSLAISFFLVYGLWLLITKHWKMMIGLLTGAIVVLASFLLFNVDWLLAWLNTGSSKLPINAPYTLSIWGLSALLSGGSTQWFIYGGIAALVIFIVTFILLYKSPWPSEGITLVSLIPLALLLAPSIWSYGQIYLLIPIVFILAGLDRLNASFVFVGSFFILFDMLALALLFIATQVGHDIWSVLLSVFAMITLVLVWQEVRRRKLSDVFLIQSEV